LRQCRPAEQFAMAEHEHIDFNHERRGILHVYRTKRDFDHALKVNVLLQKGGLDRRAVSNEEIHSIEPGGFFTPSDSTGDIHKFTRGLASACERHGADFLLDRTVQAIENGSTGIRINVTVGSADGVGYANDVIEAMALSYVPASAAANSPIALGIGSMFIR
jgi:D-amino-acid dehydrogenase